MPFDCIVRNDLASLDKIILRKPKMDTMIEIVTAVDELRHTRELQTETMIIHSKVLRQLVTLMMVENVLAVNIIVLL